MLISRRGSIFRNPSQLATVAALLASSFVLANSLASCGSDGESGGCTPGEQNSCVGPGQCMGTQTCGEDGNSFSTCDCNIGSSGGSGGGGMGNAGSSSGGSSMGGNATLPPLINQVGTPCEQDTDCPSDGNVSLLCITPGNDDAFFGLGAPQGGYCSYRCSVGGGECESVDPNSTCDLVDDSGNNGYCVALCEPGDAQGRVKCGNNPQACVPVQQDLGICAPLCQSDEACGEGRFCGHFADVPDLTLCVEDQPMGGVLGANCAAETEAEDCGSGICLEDRFTNANGEGSVVLGNFCSAYCTFGLISGGCGYTSDSGEPREGACILPRYQGAGPGDVGYCVEMCDTDADCEQEAYGCQLDTRYAPWGRDGVCVPDSVLEAGGGADAAVPAVDAGPDAN